MYTYICFRIYIYVQLQCAYVFTCMNLGLHIRGNADINAGSNRNIDIKPDAGANRHVNAKLTECEDHH